MDSIALARKRRARWRAKNPLYHKNYYRKNRKKLAAANKKWKQNNRARVNELERNRYAANLEKERERCRKKGALSKDRVLESNRRWLKENPAKARARWAKYRAIKKKATPSWADHTAIGAVYSEAFRCGLTVDHIVPLTHPNVCGLHVSWNLQLLTGVENSRKGNRLESAAA